MNKDFFMSLNLSLLLLTPGSLENNRIQIINDLADNLSYISVLQIIEKKNSSIVAFQFIANRLIYPAI